MHKFAELILSERSTPVAIVVGEKLHRGYRDNSGVFTLEGDNIDSANETVVYPTELPDDGEYILCQRCF
jgi:hypothetical protein